mmetsp:Transcript_107247/g.212892  ORF Transcript_107247/g.212892 Transcript_107247/m.212892 type:complete len:193 (+) Transcript_107247:66-644(+)
MVCWDVEKTGVCPRTSSGRNCKWCSGAPDEDWQTRGAKPKAAMPSRSFPRNVGGVTCHGKVIGVRQTQFQKPAIGANLRPTTVQQPQSSSVLARARPQIQQYQQLQQQKQQQQQQQRQPQRSLPLPQSVLSRQRQTVGTNLRPQSVRRQNWQPTVVCDDMRRLGTCPRGDECTLCKAMFESCGAIDFGDVLR